MADDRSLEQLRADIDTFEAARKQSDFDYSLYDLYKHLTAVSRIERAILEQLPVHEQAVFPGSKAEIETSRYKPFIKRLLEASVVPEQYPALRKDMLSGAYRFGQDDKPPSEAFIAFLDTYMLRSDIEKTYNDRVDRLLGKKGKSTQYSPTTTMKDAEVAYEESYRLFYFVDRCQANNILLAEDQKRLQPSVIALTKKRDAYEQALQTYMGISAKTGKELDAKSAAAQELQHTNFVLDEVVKRWMKEQAQQVMELLRAADIKPIPAEIQVSQRTQPQTPARPQHTR